MDFVEKYRNDVEGSEQLTNEIASTYAKSICLTEQSDGNYIRAFAFDIRISLLNIIQSFDAIKKAVIDGKFVVAYDKESRLRLLELVFDKAHVENCVGSELKKGGVYTTDGHYILEAFPDGDDIIVIDLNFLQDDKEDLYKGIFVPGTNRKARLIKCSVKDEDVLTEYSANLHGANGSSTKWTLHRLLQIQRQSAGDDFDQREIVQKHLDLKPCQHFKEAASFRFAPLSERGIRQMMLRFGYLKKRSWEKLEFGS